MAGMRLTMRRSKYAQPCFTIGEAYRGGDGIQQDIEKAAHWYAKGTGRGEPDSRRAMALCYENGWGVKPDPEKAKRLRS